MESKQIMQQVNAILMGTEILLSKEEIPLRDRKMIYRIQSAAEELYQANATEEELTLFKEKEKNKLSEKVNDQIKMLDVSDQLTIYKSYISDAQKISENLEERFHNDLELFRVNVHGIKSMSRQLGYMQMGEAGEIMEMAAKAKHLPFIEKNLNGFLADLRIAISDAKEQATLLEEKLLKQDVIKQEPKEQDADDLIEKLEELRSAFGEFELDKIEQLISQLKQVSWNEHKAELFEKICSCVDDLEYEEGMRLIDEIKR